MKRLIAVVSCRKYVYEQNDNLAHATGPDATRASIIRETWYKLWEKYKDEIDLKFFYGVTEEKWRAVEGKDSVTLSVPDGYVGLPKKVQGIYKWALAEGYDYVLKVDDDVFVYPDRLLEAFREHDYTGSQNPDSYISGACYWVSRKAMESIVAAPVDDTVEDRWVGKVLMSQGFVPVHNERFQNCHCELCREKFGPNFISFHCWPTVEIMRELMPHEK